MHKRILSFLLALLMIVSIFPASVYATDRTVVTTSTETACPTCATLGCTSGHINWCDICKVDSCGKDHSGTDNQTQETSSDQVNTVSGDETPHPMVGKRVVLNSSWPWAYKDYNNFNDGKQLNASKFLVPLRIAEVYAVSETTTIYKLETGDGSAWPAGYEGYCYIPSTSVTVVEQCGTCGEFGCTTEHIKCEFCGEYDCEETHISTTVTDSDGNEHKVFVSGNALPEGAKLEVTPVANENAIKEELGMEGGFIWDIKVYDADGNEWQPGNGETVVLGVEIASLEDGSLIDIMHFLESADEITAAIESGNAEIGDANGYSTSVLDTFEPAILAYSNAMSTHENKLAAVTYESVEIKNAMACITTTGFSIYSWNGSYSHTRYESGSGERFVLKDSNGQTLFVTRGQTVYLDSGHNAGNEDHWTFSGPITVNGWSTNDRPYVTVNSNATLGASCSMNIDYNGVLGIGAFDHTVYFVVVEERTVYYNGNGGTPTVTSNTAITDGGSRNQYVALPNATRTGYTFLGWYTATSGGKREGGNGTSYMPTSNGVTLYAQWSANNYTVSFNANGGSVSPTTKSVTYDSAYGDLPTPTQKDYRFLGWYTAASGGTQVTKDTIYKTAGNSTLYAHWEFDVQIADGFDGYLNPAGPALPSGYSYKWSKRSGTYSYDVTTWSNSWSDVSTSNMSGNAVDVLKDGGYVHEDAGMTSGTKYQYRLQAVSGSTVIGTTYYTVDYGTQLLNSSFEIPSFEKYNRVFYYNDHENLFWKSTAPLSEVTNGQLEIGPSTADYYGPKTAIHGKQFAELNADMAAALYQDVFTEPGKNLTWAINHSARRPSTDYPVTLEDEMYVIITSSKTAVNITTQEQIDAVVAAAESLAATYTAQGNTAAAAGVFSGEYDVAYNGIEFRIWRCVSQFISSETWTKYAGQYQVPDGQKMTRFFFSAGNTATGNRTIGNLLDAVEFDDSIHYVINYHINGTLIPALSEEGVKGPGDVVKATKVGTLTANDATYFSAIYLNNTQQPMAAEPSITMDASRGNVLNLYFISQHKVTLDQTDATTPSNVTQYYYRYNTTKNFLDGKLIYYYTERACTNPMVNGTGETKYYSIVPPKRTGYAFGGYFTQTNGQGVQYIDKNGMCVNNIWQNVAADSTLYAYWIPQYQYTLTFDANGDNVTGMPSNQNIDWVADATMTFTWTQEPVRAGYAFQGWAESASATTGSKAKSTTVTGLVAGKATKTLYAIWLPAYTVNGQINNGGTITVADGGTNPQSVVSGQRSKAITFTPATGYVISGITITVNGVTRSESVTGNEESYTYSATTVTGDVTVAVTTKKNVFTITWIDGDGKTLKTEKLTYGDTPIYSGETPTKAATAQYFYTWNNTWSPTVAQVTQDATYTAQFTPTVRTYTVTWVVEGKEKDKDLWKYGDMPVYSGETPVKAEDDGYTYQWKGEWTPVVVPVVDTVTYKAVFEKTAKTFAITYELGNGELPAGVTNPGSYNVQTDTFELNNPERTGYAFIGWTGSNGTTPQTTVNVEKGTTGNLSFTANWEAKNVSYQVVHWKQAIGGGSEYNETNFPNKETQNLLGKADSKVTPSVKPYEGFTAPAEVEVTLEADGSTVVNYYYTRNTYTIRFNNNEGTGTMADMTLAYEQSAKLAVNAFTRQGYSFKGWAATGDGTAAYADQAEVKSLTTQNGAVIDLYAVWEINLFDLIIKTNNTLDANQSYIFTVTGTAVDGTQIDLQVAMGANDEQKIVGVPAGSYTVADQQGWSWRYDHQEQTQSVYTDVVADFSYTYSRMINSKIFWLNGYGNEQIRKKENNT